ncbi:hypothetical protein [Nocardioides panzhihuensis]|uniref:Mce-associated membrane protein n=1 Tax=Nocardioides panzhihuensis TaxID=860243 RepID=A0A7Z0DTC5_9ACTN|nr:hypothetical protein [Nocardioides panzhihuensis]NYI80941.1 Mce-associated membrane protein [Nocardioides panzhihuensis]
MSRLSTRTFVLLLVLGIGLLAFAGQRAWSWREDVSAEHQRAEAVSAASTEVTRLISVSAEDSEAAFESLLDGATASFRSDLKQQASALQKALKANKVDAEGEVVSAGVARSTDEQVTVYIAATGTVSNSGTKAPQQRGYRVKVEMRNVEGRWLVSGLEFIP